MNQIEAAFGESNKTILDLQTRLGNAAAQICGLMEQIESLTKERDALKPKEPAKLESVPNPAAQEV